jgi:hypothetical protein
LAPRSIGKKRPAPIPPQSIPDISKEIPTLVVKKSGTTSTHSTINLANSIKTVKSTSHRFVLAFELRLNDNFEKERTDGGNIYNAAHISYTKFMKFCLNSCHRIDITLS